MQISQRDHQSDPKWGRLRIEPTWGLEHRELNYHNEPFNDPISEVHWRGLGYTQRRFTGDMYDMRRDEPGMIARFRELFPWRHFSWSFYRMRPGDVLPEHRDTYARFREIYQVAPDSVIRRAVFFLEDWHSGHYLEIDGEPVTKWSAGDGVFWHDDTPHLAANMGKTHRYTLQITGLADQTINPNVR